MISLDRVKELLDYDPQTGDFRWKVTRGRAKVGAVAGKFNKRGCRHIVIDMKEFKAHRLAWFYVHGEWPTGYIDHINRNPLDNRIENLREATYTLSLANRMLKAGKSGSKGAILHQNGRFVARIAANGTNYHLGVFDTAAEAHAAYQGAARILFGKYACFEAA